MNREKMEKKPLYIKPEIEIVALKDHLMLDIGVHNSFVDDEAAKQGTIDTGDMWEGYEDIWATKPSKEVESPNVWGDE